MSAKSQKRSHVRFGVFEANFASYELRKHGTRVRLRGQPLDLLQLLVERRGEIVPRDEMKTRLWPKDTFVDFENGLNAAIKKLRSVLGDSRESPRYIETIPRVGYCFIAPVEEVSESKVPAVDRQDIGRGPGATVPREALSQRRWQVALGIAVGVIVALGGYIEWSGSRARLQPSGGRSMLAVLPFENLTGDAAQDYFSDGLTEEMITELGRLRGDQLGVIARTSVMQYKHGEKTVAQIGRELGVQFVLEGSVRRANGRVRIAAQLIRVSDQSHLWAEDYEGELKDILTVQSQVAQAIAHEIRLELPPSQQERLANSRRVDPQTYEDYLKGRHFLNQRTAEGFQKAADHFREAITRDPSYAPAYSGLAESFVLSEQYSLLPEGEALPKADEAARKALELDDTLADAYALLAAIRVDAGWDWLQAEHEYKRAVTLNSSSAIAHQWYAEYLSAVGRHAEAIGEIKKAQELDPISLIINTVSGEVSYFAREYEPAVQECRKALEIDPNFAPAHSFLGMIYEQQGKYAEAEGELQKAISLSGGSPKSTAYLGHAYAMAGRNKQAKITLDQIKMLSHRRYVSPVDLAILYGAMGKKDLAFASLEEAFNKRDHWLVYCNVDPKLDSVRGDVRFDSLMRRVGLIR